MLSPRAANAESLTDRLEVSAYGRVGVAWTLQGRFIQGKTFNLLGNSIGGRMEEGDYLEPTLRVHLLPPRPGADQSPRVDVVLTPALSAPGGTFIGAFRDGQDEMPRLTMTQAYVEVGNVLVPGLKLWAGARYYRGANVHIADSFYFNNLSGQGAGAQYGSWEMAVLLREDKTANVRRQRTVLVSQYIQPLASGHSLHLLAELHHLPAANPSTPDSGKMPPGTGWVTGLNGHLALGQKGFNDLSVRIGDGIANGGRGGSQTWDTFAPSVDVETYEHALGVELVDHFLYDFGSRFSLNAYGILHWNQGPTGKKEDRSLDFAVGARGTFYLSDHIHLVQEASFQGLMETPDGLATAVKLTLMPTLVPSGERDVWARPHLRFFYTLALYGGSQRDTPYLQEVGTSEVGTRRMGHVLGTRLEWWF